MVSGLDTIFGLGADIFGSNFGCSTSLVFEADTFDIAGGALVLAAGLAISGCFLSVDSALV